mmetsp:Transcript_56013/g.149421  ORF Transcript_56013/g.149421 Transcript_56013/m.149421 type:complete len:237 (+) Transcript_56013:732-1442(+)
MLQTFAFAALTNGRTVRGDLRGTRGQRRLWEDSGEVRARFHKGRWPEKRRWWPDGGESHGRRQSSTTAQPRMLKSVAETEASVWFMAQEPQQQVPRLLAYALPHGAPETQLSNLLAFWWRPPTKHCKQRGAQTKHVDLLWIVALLPWRSVSHLWRHVVLGPEQTSRRARARVAQILAQPKVHEFQALQPPGLQGRRQENVLGLEIAVYHVVRVAVPQCLSCFNQDSSCLLLGQTST